MAPIAATVAATVAVGVGVALARAGRERNTERLRNRERKLGLLPGEPLSCGLERMAIGQAETAIEQLQGTQPGEAPGAEAVHEARKALKRLRALMRLLEYELGTKRFAREDAALRCAARQLAGARDAEVMLATLDALIARHPRRLAKHKGVRKFRRVLLSRRRQLRDRTGRRGEGHLRAVSELSDFRARAERWNLPDIREARLIESGLARLYEQGRSRYRRAARRNGRDVEAMHRWRKRVKDLRYAAEMLERHTPAGSSPSNRARSLQTLAKLAEDLGETLGEDHDLAMLAALVRASRKPKHKRARPVPKPERLDRSTRKLLLKLIARRRRELRREALRDGKRLYRRKPKRFVRRLS